ncbi:MAG: CopG family transcriptional regulator [Thermoflexales bacterium]
MRTTLTLEDDVAANLVELQKKTGLSFKDITNRTLRIGLEQQLAESTQPRPRFKVRARPMGTFPGVNYANIGDMIEQLEGPAHR